MIVLLQIFIIKNAKRKNAMHMFINNNARFCYQSKEKVLSSNIFGRMYLIIKIFVLILKGENTGSSLLTLIISGLTLHAWLFIEIQLNGVALNRFTYGKTVNPFKNIF